MAYSKDEIKLIMKSMKLDFALEKNERWSATTLVEW